MLHGSEIMESMYIPEQNANLMWLDDQERLASARPTAKSFTTTKGEIQSVFQQRPSHLPGIQDPGLYAPVLRCSSIADFEKKIEIYSGRHSTVTLSTYIETGLPVVVKAYIKSKLQARHHKNVRREIQCLQQCARHRFTGVVAFFGTFEDDECIYIVQENCGRGDLFKEMIRQGGVMKEMHVCTEVIIPLLLTLAFIHANGIIHRDIKPENLFLAGNGSLKLGDFGLAIRYFDERAVSRVGTLDYMSPEVLAMPGADEIAKRELKPADMPTYGVKVDVWAAGVLTYELLVGRPPFEVDDPNATAQLIIHAPVHAFPPHLSPACVAFIQLALSKAPGERPGPVELLQHAWIRPHYTPPVSSERPLQHTSSTPITSGRLAHLLKPVGRTQSLPCQPIPEYQPLSPRSKSKFQPSHAGIQAFDSIPGDWKIASGQEGGLLYQPQHLISHIEAPVSEQPPMQLGGGAVKSTPGLASVLSGATSVSEAKGKSIAEEAEAVCSPPTYQAMIRDPSQLKKTAGRETTRPSRFAKPSVPASLLEIAAPAREVKGAGPQDMEVAAEEGGISSWQPAEMIETSPSLGSGSGAWEADNSVDMMLTADLSRLKRIEIEASSSQREDSPVDGGLRAPFRTLLDQPEDTRMRRMSSPSRLTARLACISPRLKKSVTTPEEYLLGFDIPESARSNRRSTQKGDGLDLELPESPTFQDRVKHYFYKHK